MSKKALTFFVGLAVFTFAAIAIYAATDNNPTQTGNTSITNTQVCAKMCEKVCGNCEDCDGDCENCDKECCANCQKCESCDKPCKGNGDGCGGNAEETGTCQKNKGCGGCSGQ